MGPENTVHYIDPAGEHVLVPKSTATQRRNSEPNISKNITRNNKNVRLVPMEQKKQVTDGSAAAAPNPKKLVSGANPVSDHHEAVRKATPPNAGGNNAKKNILFNKYENVV